MDGPSMFILNFQWFISLNGHLTLNVLGYGYYTSMTNGRPLISLNIHKIWQVTLWIPNLSILT